jgi:Flp pilus assembly protein TadG
MTEFALAVPVMLLVVFAIAQFGITFNHYVTLTDAVRAGARTAAISRQAPNPVGDTETQVRSAATNLNQASLNVTVSSLWQHGGNVTVTGTYPYSINLLGVVVASGTLTSTTTERVE